MSVTSQFADMTSSPNRFVIILFLYRYFMSISWLFLELWQFSFIVNSPEIRKSELPSSEFCPIGRVRDTMSDTNVSNKMLLNAEKMKLSFKCPKCPTFMIKALFILKISKFLSWPFCHAGKRLDKKANFKIYGVTDCQTNNYNTHIAQYLKR